MLRRPLTTPVAVALTALAAFLWGTSFPVNHVGLFHLDPGTFSFARFAVGALSATAVALALGLYRPRLLLSWEVWLMGLFNSLGFLLQYMAQELTSPAKAALLINANAVVVAVLAVLMLRERLTRPLVAGIVLAVVGVFFLTTEGRIENLRGGSVLGDALAFLAGATWSVFIILNKRFLHGGHAEQENLMGLAAAVFTATAVLTFPLGFAMWSDSFLRVPAAGVWPILYAGLLCTTTAYLLWTVALRRLSASVSAVVLLLEVPVATVLSVGLGYEALTLAAALGGLLLFAAIAWVSLYEARASPPAPP